MTEKRTSLFENGLIWFGAGVSIAEILTGTFLAPLGIGKGLAAIFVGHLIGAVLFFLCAYISAGSRKSSMEAVKMTYGSRGGIFFAVLNVLQLVGWTGIMIYDGALAAAGIWSTGRWIWCLIIGALILLWILVGITNLGKINTVAMTALFILTLLLCLVITRESGAAAPILESISFGGALELSVSMPLSWLLVVGDYTREARKPFCASLVSTIVYTVISSWMFAIGMGAAILTGSSDIAEIMLRAGLGAAGLLIIVFSTVTTTFLDAFSAGISTESILPGLGAKPVAILVTVAGVVSAILFPMDDITEFLYLIGSVFAPMAAVMIGNHYLLDTDSSGESLNRRSLLVWLLGFLLYRFLMRFDFPIGYTLPDILLTLLLTVGAGRVFAEKGRRGTA